MLFYFLVYQEFLLRLGVLPGTEERGSSQEVGGSVQPGHGGKSSPGGGLRISGGLQSFVQSRILR